jgi:hypothetical protein
MHRISTKTEILFFLVSVRHARFLCAVSFVAQRRQSLCIDSNECISSILWGFKSFVGAQIALYRRMHALASTLTSARRGVRRTGM